MNSFNVSNILTKSVLLTWTFGFSGNSEITGTFLLYETEANFKKFQSLNQTISVQDPSAVQELGIDMLEPNTQYSFSLSVMNGIGSSDTVTVLRWTLPVGELKTIKRYGSTS